MEKQRFHGISKTRPKIAFTPEGLTKARQFIEFPTKTVGFMGFLRTPIFIREIVWARIVRYRAPRSLGRDTASPVAPRTTVSTRIVIGLGHIAIMSRYFIRQKHVLQFWTRANVVNDQWISGTEGNVIRDYANMRQISR